METWDWPKFFTQVRPEWTWCRVHLNPRSGQNTFCTGSNHYPGPSLIEELVKCNWVLGLKDLGGGQNLLTV